MSAKERLIAVANGHTVFLAGGAYLVRPVRNPGFGPVPVPTLVSAFAVIAERTFAHSKIPPRAAS